MRKRLAIFLPALPGGGAERVMLNLAAGFTARGHAVDLVLAKAEGAYLYAVPAAVRLIELNLRKLPMFRTLTSLPALMSYLRRERPDALLSGLHANIIAIWGVLFSGRPQRLAISEHSTFSRQTGEAPVWYGKVMRRLVRRFYPAANEIIAVSEGVADDLSRATGIARARIRVIYNPIITPEIEKKAREALEHPWFLPAEPPVVLAIGRLAAEKDFGLLIRAFAKARGNSKARLLILGEGEKRSELEALVHSLKLERDVGLPGFVENPYSYMAGASMVVLSSRWEGLPTVLVEALHCGTPVIATDCPSGPREILEEGRYGQLVPVGDVDAMARAMRAVLSGAVRLPPRRCLARYELEPIVSQYERILLGA
ncbi:MAG: glycosyltransferase [Syntrophobacteraceae bacterium]